MSNEPTDMRTLEMAGQLGLFTHEDPPEEDIEETDLEYLVNARCREQLEEQLYRDRILAFHPEFEEEDLEEEDLEEEEDLDDLLERLELLECTGDFETAVVLSALETGKSIDEARTDPRTRARVLSRLLDSYGEVRAVLEAESLIPADTEPEDVHDLIHGRGKE